MCDIVNRAKDFVKDFLNVAWFCDGLAPDESLRQYWSLVLYITIEFLARSPILPNPPLNDPEVIEQISAIGAGDSLLYPHKPGSRRARMARN
jgi:hypothetical protein